MKTEKPSFRRQTVWARKKRDELRNLLGFACAKCGYQECFDDGRHLEFDCIIPQGHDHHVRRGFSSRMSFYNQQYKAGNLQLLCAGKHDSCHAIKSLSEQP